MVFESPRGTRVEILESTPERFSFERTMAPLTGGKGKAVCELVGREHVLSAGDVLQIPPGSAHENAYTDAGQRATIVQTVAPNPLSVEIYFTSWLMWLEQGKADDHDEPTLLQLMAIGKAGGRGDTWSAGQPIVMQKVATVVLGNLAWLLGIRAARVSR